MSHKFTTVSIGTVCASAAAQQAFLMVLHLGYGKYISQIRYFTILCVNNIQKFRNLGLITKLVSGTVINTGKYISH